MLYNYLLIAFRNIKRNKLRTFVHVFGLSLGIAICLLIFNQLLSAYSFDRFHPDEDRIYRLNTYSEWQPGEFFQSSGTNGPLGEVLDEELSLIESKARLYHLYETMVSIPEQNKVIGRKRGVAFADDGFFEIFPRKWLAGNPTSALSEPNVAVISESSLLHYFPGLSAGDVIGKEVLWVDSDSIYAQIRGVVADFKENSDFIFTDFISFKTIQKMESEDWYGLHSWNNLNSSSQLFVKVNEGVLKNELDEALLGISKKYLGEEGNNTTFIGEPIAEMHFSENYDDSTISKPLLRGLTFVGLIILALACLNFINLETAHAISRAKEVGIRKSLGSDRAQLMLQFLSETFLIVFVASLFSLLIADQIHHFFKDYFLSEFTFSILEVKNCVFIFSIALLLTILSGIYPALIQSSYHPQRALKGEVNYVNGFSIGVFLRKNLTIFQFAVSIAFIIMVAVISTQLKYISSTPLGFEKNAVLFTDLPFMGDRVVREQLSDRIRQESFVKGVSMSGVLVTSNSIWTSDAFYLKDTIENALNVHVMNVDSAFVGTHQISLLAGRNTNNQEDEIVVNLNFVKTLGFSEVEDMIGSTLRLGNELRTIVGVVDNFNARSLKEEIMPIVLIYRPDYFHMLTAKVSNGQNLAYMKQRLEDIYAETYPFETANFSFLDEVVESFYENDRKINGVLFFAAAIAILISILGLFGLSSFTIAQRTKEMNIRKVLGAGVLQIVGLISRQYVWLVSISFVLAIYPAYYISKLWLEDYAYRISMPYFLFAVVGLGVMIMALLVVGFHSLGVAQSNPAKVLKSE
ncbi:ABC transporter permease [Belliella sp. DSM 107340]|uniref:ABC transporter permease n=1 Tax=Belliella calami TaxID=2923436 RepID=A0ABS9UT31_9BACT|nr:ABC transporter permease [Belliella calami]MCH7399781.1 ABC transporter permease [Belliella calami]